MAITAMLCTSQPTMIATIVQSASTIARKITPSNPSRPRSKSRARPRQFRASGSDPPFAGTRTANPIVLNMATDAALGQSSKLVHRRLRQKGAQGELPSLEEYEEANRKAKEAETEVRVAHAFGCSCLEVDDGAALTPKASTRTIAAKEPQELPWGDGR